MTTSTALVSSAGVFATAAPAWAVGLVFSAVRFHTISVWPTSISRAPMFEPMLPMPAMPIRITRCPSLHPVLDLIQRRNRAIVIEIAAGRAAHADTADRFIACHDGDAAGREIDVRQAGEPGGGHARRLGDALREPLGRAVLA